jgi:LasA protease
MSTNNCSVLRALPFALLPIGLDVAASPGVPTALEREATNAFRQTVDARPTSAVSGKELLVEILKQDGRGEHVLGAVTRMLPPDVHGTPETTFFFAHQDAGRWTVGLSGTDAFLRALQAMPADVVDAEERHAFALTQSADTTTRAGTFILLGLPWAVNQSWEMSSGPHGDDGPTRPFNALDFWSAEGSVRAPAAGRVYKTCEVGGSGLVTVIHGNGYTTSYYHMVDLTTFNHGTPILAGDYLGKVGNALPCGGQSSGPHVHFALQQGNQKVAVDNQVLGGWTFHESPVPYQGKAVRGAEVVFPLPNRMPMKNYGPADPGL